MRQRIVALAVIVLMIATFFSFARPLPASATDVEWPSGLNPEAQVVIDSMRVEYEGFLKLVWKNT